MTQIFRRRIRVGRCLKSIVRRIAERMSIVNCQVLAKKGIVYCQVLAKKSIFFVGTIVTFI